MVVTLFLLALAAAFFWAGFLTPPRVWQYRSRVGFVVMLALAGFAGYFAWREARTIHELARLIDPVPEITQVTYVPTAAEVAAIAQVLASMPAGRLGPSRAVRRDLAERAREDATAAKPRHTGYWLLKTALAVDSVFAFYREAAPRRGWTVQTDEAPWVSLARGKERLVLFVSDDFPRPSIKVLYGYSVGEP